MSCIYTTNCKVKSYDADSSCNWRPAAFLNTAQDCANIHAAELGFGYEDLMAGNMIWVLSRIRVDFLCVPKWRQEIKVSTWHRGAEGLFAMRDFEVRDAQTSELLVVATSAWLIIDVNTRRIKRIDRVLNTDTWINSINSRSVFESPICEKIHRPQCADELLDNGSFALVRPILYSDVDMNLHANNARYMEWTMDALEQGLSTVRPIASFQIHYNSEIRLGESLSILCADITSTDTLNNQQQASLKHYVEGVKDGRSIYQCVVEFAPQQANNSAGLCAAE